jgi:hypothetical protein
MGISNTKRLVNTPSRPPQVEIRTGFDAGITSTVRPAALGRKEETPVPFHSNGHGTVPSARNVHLGRASELATGILPMGKHFFVLHPRANAAGSPPASLQVMLA